MQNPLPDGSDNHSVRGGHTAGRVGFGEQNQIGIGKLFGSCCQSSHLTFKCCRRGYVGGNLNQPAVSCKVGCEKIDFISRSGFDVGQVAAFSGQLTGDKIFNDAPSILPGCRAEGIGKSVIGKIELARIAQPPRSTAGGCRYSHLWREETPGN